MSLFVFSAILGIIIAIIDVVPMIMKKMPCYSIIAAFFHYFFVTIVIVNTDIPGLPWWLKGGVIGLALMLPMLIHVGHDDKRPIPVITANAIILGTVVSVATHYYYF
ncbi:hypothetical protein [Coprobacter tertius]|uniref:Uncharacterized protein n=1 Tax=Coprobacter tertius TaxID=2944915 RepID=A0ABT1MFK0_9BACT|nr:hypothetical protein [Coprobacter tertius]MCP9611129.1 hypothetical protein [Coprobacter tertius]